MALIPSRVPNTCQMLGTELNQRHAPCPPKPNRTVVEFDSGIHPIPTTNLAVVKCGLPGHPPGLTRGPAMTTRKGSIAFSRAALTPAQLLRRGLRPDCDAEPRRQRQGIALGGFDQLRDRH